MLCLDRRPRHRHHHLGGLFTAGSNTASGKIKVASGNYAVTISVSVTAPAKYTLLSDFEGSDPGFSAQNATPFLNDTQVRYGSQSLQVALSERRQADRPLRDRSADLFPAGKV